MITAEAWYDPQPDPSNLYQGDVIRQIPFPKWPTFEAANQKAKWAILRPAQQGEKTLEEVFRALPNKLIARAASDVPDAFNYAQKEFVVGACIVSDVMIISRSCSLDNPKRKHFLVSPVVYVNSLPEAQKTAEILDDLRLGNIPHRFYLPAVGTITEAFADLLRMTPIHRSFFDGEDVGLVHRLSSVGMMALQQSLSNHFGMKFGFDHEDTCPQSGPYRCSNCFHSGQPTERMQFEEGKPFGACPQCGEDAAFVKMPT